MKCRQLVIYLFLAMPALAGPAAAQLTTSFRDGGFAKPTPKSGSFLIIDSGERYGNWRTVGVSGNVSYVNGAYTHDGFNFLAQGTGSAQTTNAWVNLAGISQSATGIAHEPTITTPGTTYILSFYVGNIYDPGGPYGTSSTIAVYANSTFIGNFTNSGGQGSTNENWQQFTVPIVVNDPYMVISFINADPPGDLNCGLDNVTFKPVHAPDEVTK